MVVDDRMVMRNGLRDTLEASGSFEVVGQAGDGEETVRIVEGMDPEVIVMDVIMPNMDGIDACREIMDLLPETRVLMLMIRPICGGGELSPAGRSCLWDPFFWQQPRRP